MRHPISILKTQNRRCVESPVNIKVDMFFLFTAHLPSETGHCCVALSSLKQKPFLVQVQAKNYHLKLSRLYLSSERPKKSLAEIKSQNRWNSRPTVARFLPLRATVGLGNVYAAPFYYLLSISWHQEFYFFISRNRILDIKNSISWYQEIFTISWYQEIEFLISRNDFLILRIPFLDIRKWI